MIASCFDFIVMIFNPQILENNFLTQIEKVVI